MNAINENKKPAKNQRNPLRFLLIATMAVANAYRVPQTKIQNISIQTPEPNAKSFDIRRYYLNRSTVAPF